MSLRSGRYLCTSADQAIDVAGHLGMGSPAQLRLLVARIEAAVGVDKPPLTLASQRRPEGPKYYRGSDVTLNNARPNIELGALLDLRLASASENDWGCWLGR